MTEAAKHWMQMWQTAVELNKKKDAAYKNARSECGRWRRECEELRKENLRLKKQLKEFIPNLKY